MKKVWIILLATVLLLAFCAAAQAEAISVSGLSEMKLYDLYSQVQSQIQLKKLKDGKTYSSSFSYDDIERNPDKHKGETIRFEGKVIQVVEGSPSTTYRITSGKNSSDVFLVTYARPADSERFLEDDTVIVYAEFKKLNTYSSTVNLSVTAPYCEAALIIRPVSDKKVKAASMDELEAGIKTIRKRLNKVVEKDKGYSKVTKVNYEDFARHENLHSKEKLKITGKVLQVVEGTSSNTIRLAVDSDSDKVFYLTMKPSVTDIRILENDKITVRGKYTGLYTYSSTRGGDITIPSASVEKVSVSGYKSPDKTKSTGSDKKDKKKSGTVKLTKNNFQDYARRPKTHLNEKITFSGKVIQVIEGSTTSEYRVAVDSDSSCVIYVKIANSKRSTRVLENDKVSVKATFTGTLSYESTIGKQVTIPQCKASKMTVSGQKKSTDTSKKQDTKTRTKVTKKNYDDFARNADKYKKRKISFTAKVLQVIEGSDSTRYRLAVDKNSNCVFMATISNSKLKSRILEDDEITVKGTVTGLYSYQSIMSGQITIPACTITKYSVKGGKTDGLGSKDKWGYYRITTKNFKELARNPKPYEGKKITFKAKVIQVVERSGTNIYRVAVEKDYDCIFYVEYDLPSGASRILEGDYVTLKGKYTGIYTYTTIFGSSVSIPSIEASSMKK